MSTSSTSSCNADSVASQIPQTVMRFTEGQLQIDESPFREIKWNRAGSSHANLCSLGADRRFSRCLSSRANSLIRNDSLSSIWSDSDDTNSVFSSSDGTPFNIVHTVSIVEAVVYCIQIYSVSLSS